MTRPPLAYDKDRLVKSYAAARAATDDTALPTHRLYLSGTDYSTPQPQLTAMRRDLNDGVEDTAFVHCRLEEYAQALRAHLDTGALRTIQGELRDGPAGDCSGNALSSRIYLKTANKMAQNQLLRWAEPLSAVMRAVGEAYPRGMLAKAWDYMLKAHPHDSINGVTQDKTANNVEYRLAQALEIAQVVTDEAAARLAKRLDTSSFGEDALLLLCVNPHPYPVREVMRVNLLTPAADGIWDLRATDTDGNPLELQSIARDEKAYPVHDTEARPWPYKAYRHLCYLDAGELPAMGYKVVRFVPTARFEAEHFYWLPMRRARHENPFASELMLENEHLRVEFHPNGSLRLTQKATGRIYDNLHYLEDSGDVGNYWAYYPPYHNQIHTTLSGNARLWSEEAGPLSATIAVEYTMRLPATAEEPAYGVRGESKRSATTESLVVTSRFTLRRNSRRLEVRTIVDNNVGHHRLRVAFPTGIQTDFADAAGHFTVDHRPKVNQPAEDETYWPEMQTLPMQSFVDVSDDRQGFAVLNDCLTEYELANDRDATLYLTLFRAMGNMIVTWWEAVGQFADQTGSQLQRRMAFHYALYPHDGNWQHGEVYREAQSVNTAPCSWQLFCGGPGDLPLNASFCHVSNQQVVLSAMKRTEDRDTLLLRLYNPTPDAQRTTVTLGFVADGAWMCDLNETRETPLAVHAQQVALEIPAGKIVTVEIALL